ncbi:homoserine o-acetyltransferase [Pyrenophora tritici-repentis]|nr:homoserine o-acetyltransferase [Pyrenophora tritici-repentis]
MASGTIVDGANGSRKYRTLSSQPENPFAKLIPDQSFAVIPQVTLESGVVLQNVSVAYKTYGTLAPGGDNAMVICHALTGSADVGDLVGTVNRGPWESIRHIAFLRRMYEQPREPPTAAQAQSRPKTATPHWDSTDPSSR